MGFCGTWCVGWRPAYEGLESSPRKHSFSEYPFHIIRAAPDAADSFLQHFWYWQLESKYFPSNRQRRAYEQLAWEITHIPSFFGDRSASEFFKKNTNNQATKLRTQSWIRQVIQPDMQVGTGLGALPPFPLTSCNMGTARGSLLPSWVNSSDQNTQTTVLQQLVHTIIGNVAFNAIWNIFMLHMILTLFLCIY